MFEVPIGFFVFNRLDTTMEVFSRIKEIQPKKLYLISDGPRENHHDEENKVKQVRKYIEDNIDWECSVFKNYSKTNLGCKNRMSSGITWIFDNEEQAIILEDDVKPTLDFFYFTKELLDKYKNNPNVMMITGFKKLNSYYTNDSYIFSNHAMIWGWATWRRAWEQYDVDIVSWEVAKKDGHLKRYYNFFGYIKSKKDFDSVYYHKKDTWDFQWAYTLLEHGGLCIVPCENMIENIGFGRDDATHTKMSTSQDFSCNKMCFPLQHPKKITVDSKYDKEYMKKGWGLLAVIKIAIKRLFRGKLID